VSIPSDAASRESDDIYVLDPRGTENVKIRDGALPITDLRAGLKKKLSDFRQL
jgi:hypothetical protein